MVLEIGDHPILGLGQDLGDHLDPTQGGSDPFRRGAAISREEGDVDALGLETGHDPRRVEPQPILDGQDQHGLAIKGDIDEGCTTGLEFLIRDGQGSRPGIDTLSDQPIRGARYHGLPTHPAQDAMPWSRHGVRHRQMAELNRLVPAEIKHRQGDRVFRKALQGRQTGQMPRQVRVGIQYLTAPPDAAPTGDGGHRRPTFGEGAGLVEDEVVDGGQALQHGPGLDQDAMAGAQPRGNSNGHGGRHAEGAGTGDDEDCGGRHQGDFEIGAYPEEEGHKPQGEGDGDKPGDDAIRSALDGRLARLGLLHQGDDAPQGCVSQQAFDLDPQGPRAIQGPRRHPIAPLLRHRRRLTGEHGFIQLANALQDDAIHGHLLAWPHQDGFTDSNGPDRQEHLIAAA